MTIFKMDFIIKNPEIKNNFSGTNMKPLHVGFMRSRNNLGYKEFHKIGGCYYEAMRRYTTKKDVTVMVCTHYRTGCDWSGRMTNNTSLTRDEDGYWDRPNWNMETARGTHTCEPSPESTLAKLQVRNHVRTRVEDGQTNYTKIREQLLLEEQFAQHAAHLLGDENNYRREITKIIRKKYGGSTQLESSKIPST